MIRPTGGSRKNSHIALGGSGLFGTQNSPGTMIMSATGKMIPANYGSNNATPGYDPVNSPSDAAAQTAIDPSATWRNSPSAAEINQMAGLSPTYNKDQAAQQAAINMLADTVASTGAFKTPDDWKNAFASGNPVQTMQAALQKTLGPLHVASNPNNPNGDQSFFDQNNNVLGGNINPQTGFQYGLSPQQYQQMTGKSADSLNNNGVAGANYLSMIDPSSQNKTAASLMGNQNQANQAIYNLWQTGQQTGQQLPGAPQQTQSPQTQGQYQGDVGTRAQPMAGSGMFGQPSAPTAPPAGHWDFYGNFISG